MNLATAARLGRVSNLPTVWSNVLAGVVLAGRPVVVGELLPLVAVATLLYVAGMFLNDACDAAFDAEQRPERPIPAGEVSRAAVLAWALILLGAALLLASTLGAAALLAAAATAVTIVVYDLHHKQVRVAPLIMALCRVGLYLVAAFAVVAWPPIPVWTGALALLGYVVGLTFVARHENQPTVVRFAPLLGVLGPLVLASPLLLHGPVAHRLLWIGSALWVWRSLRLARGGQPGLIRGGVVSLIAGISLVDALLIAGQGRFTLALAAVAAFAATLALQRLVAGT